MAQSYQVQCPPGTAALIAGDTKGGAGRYLIRNNHASVELMIGGDENELANDASSNPQGTSVTTGYTLAGATAITIVIGGHEAIYARSANATVTVSCTVFRTLGRDF